MSRVPTTEGPERPGILLLAGATLLAGCRTPPAPREVATPVDASPAPAAAPVLEDQLGGRWAIGEVLAGPAFIIVGGVGASERSTRWDLEVVGPLAARLGWKVHRVLCLSGYPRLFRGAVAARVRASARPPDARILLDWEDEVSRRLSCGADETTVIVLDSGGKDLGRLRGDPGPSGSTELERIAGGGAGRP